MKSDKTLKLFAILAFIAIVVFFVLAYVDLEAVKTALKDMFKKKETKYIRIN
ncbi:MAG: hypothetical protein ACOZCL_15670 [Bacillota bacterium]